MLAVKKTKEASSTKIIVFVKSKSDIYLGVVNRFIEETSVVRREVYNCLYKFFNNIIYISLIAQFANSLNPPPQISCDNNVPLQRAFIIYLVL